MNDVAVPRFPARPCPHDKKVIIMIIIIHDIIQHPVTEKRQSQSGRAAYRPSDAVDVIVNVLAHVKVDHMRNVLDVQTTRGDIRRDKDRRLACGASNRAKAHGSDYGADRNGAAGGRKCKGVLRI